MSITLYQQPTNSLYDRYIHQITYPEYYTALSSVYSTYSDFKYKFKLYTTAGLLSTSKNPPYVTAGIGVNNPNDILKQQFYVEFKPTITGYEPKSGSILGYRLDVEEYSNSITSPTNYNYTKCRALRCFKEDFDYDVYRMTGLTSRFLTNRRREAVNITYNQYATLRFLSGICVPGSAYTKNSFCYQLKLEVTDVNGVTRVYTSIDLNPYWKETTDFGSTYLTTNSTLQDVSHFLLEIPSGPKNINSMPSGWKYIGYISAAGVWYPYTGSLSTTTPIKNVGNQITDYYKIMTFQYPQGSDGITSEKYTYQIVCEKNKPGFTNVTNVQLAYENELGGFDYLNCDMARQKDMDINHSSYRKVRDEQNKNPYYTGTAYVGHDSYSRGEDIFNTDVETLWEFNTDWLSSAEILDIQDLWYSQNIFAYIDGVWYPVISLVESQSTESTKRGLRQYKIVARLSNKKYIN